MTATAAPGYIRSDRERLGAAILRAGVAIYVALLVVAPLATLVVAAFQFGPRAIWAAISASIARDALLLTAWTSVVATVITALFGTVTAWVLVRYRFVGHDLLDALVDLPFAIPTLVTGIVLVFMFGPDRLLGGWLEAHGLEVLFTPVAIILALIFVTMPFVVRAVQPVLLEVDEAEVEAARMLGAPPWMVFRRVFLPTITPVIVQGSLQTLARAVAEFGSIVVVAGNIPHHTLTAPVYIYGEIESGRPQTAAAISLVLLALSLALSWAARAIRTVRS
jgi:sulfate/thiosulfate transport system permease protein